MRKYFISGFDRNVDSILSHSVQLQAEPSMNELDHLLCDLYMQIHVKPGYLFLSLEDLEYVSREVRYSMRDMSAHRYCIRYFSVSDSIEDIAMARDYNHIRPLFHHAGGSVWTVPLSDLPKGTVILGFYPIIAEYRSQF